ncbi:hypothetical protein TNCV_3572291 [Trichonephila clavipes]|nr:hypothetical protein TNCV_3572291 [Trichonephila clavipes]
MLKTQVGSCSILEKAHFANASLLAVSAGKSSWHDCNLYGYSWRIQRRILRTDDGGKHNRLAASRALLVPEAASDAIASISTAMQAARASFKHVFVQLLLDPPTFQFPQNVSQALRDLQVLKGLFHSSHFSELGIYARQWSLILRSCKVTSPTKLHPAH